MDWERAIERNREALKRILAALVAMVEIAGGSATLPRRLHRATLRLLRPAEAAARRLVIVVARELAMTLPPPRSVRPEPEPWVASYGVSGMRMPPAATPRPALRALSLPLLDPLRRPWQGRQPVPLGVPHIWSPGMSDPYRAPDKQPPSPDDPIDAARLALRLQALGRALDDLPREALRFARWRATRDAAGAQNRNLDAAGAQGKNRPARFRRLSPLRPGRPPGSRRRPTHEVHEVLRELHYFAFKALELRPDTS